MMKRSPNAKLPSGNWRPADATLFIAGGNAFNNDMLANYLASQTGISCHRITHSQLSCMCDRNIDMHTLVFLDCTTMEEPKVCKGAAIEHLLQNTGCMVACYNVDPKAKVEGTALKKGIKGILYYSQPAELYVRAVLAILNGELWFPRATLENHILADETAPFQPEVESPMLTRREREILRLLASGITNQEIARKLCISPHTVKTHIFNLFKKINVSRRFEASQWLIDNPIK